MSVTGFVAWECDGWRGHVRADLGVPPHAVLAVVADGGGRRSRHARTVRVELEGILVYVKAYPAPDGPRAARAFRMGRALARAGFAVPEALLIGRRGGEGVLVTRDAGGSGLLDVVAAARGPVRWPLLRALGAEIGRLHAAGFVHGDLVPSNVLVRDRRIVLLDHDRTRRGRVLVWWGGRRNLVQLGRFVVSGVTLSDRARVLGSYARARGVSAQGRRRLARWLVAATTARRCRVDGLDPAAASAAGFRAVMRSGGPFDRGPGASR